MTNPLKPLSNKEALILKMLIANPKERYGLDLVGASDGLLKRGTVYVTLSRMEEKGFVESRREDADIAASSIPRRLYKPTGRGVQVFRAYEQYVQATNAVPAFA